MLPPGGRPPRRLSALLRDARVIAVQLLAVSSLLTATWFVAGAVSGHRQPLVPQLVAWSLATSLSCKPVIALLNRGSARGRPVLRLLLVGCLSAAGVATSALPSLFPVIIAGASLITLPRHPGLRTEAAAAAVMVTGSAGLIVGVQLGVVPTVLPGAAGATVCCSLVMAGLVFLRYAGALSTELAQSHSALAQEQQLRVHQLHEASTHDPLTGLLNRAGLLEVVPATLACAGPGHATGVLFLDLDAFKPVNDFYGHAAGDALLVSVAEGLRTAVRRGDHIARVGGDEFVVLLRDVADEAALRAVSERALAAVRVPVSLATSSIVVGASAGWSMTEDPETVWQVLLDRADLAMYDAKRSSQATRERNLQALPGS